MKTINETNYVDKAEKAIRSLRDKAEQQRRGRGELKIVTTSKIRNLLAMTADIYNEVVNSQKELLSTEVIGRIKYLKIRFVYESGREPKVKKLVETANILAYLDGIGNSRSQYILFSRYMEALVAYRKFYFEKDE